MPHVWVALAVGFLIVVSALDRQTLIKLGPENDVAGNESGLERYKEKV